MSDQTRKVPVTPGQRWALFNLVHAKSNEVKGQEGRVLRRFMRAFGLMAIRDVMVKEGRAAAALVSSDDPALFEITDENRDYALKLDREVDRVAALELIVGDLFDALEASRASDYKPPEGVPNFDASSEDWRPTPEEHQDLVDEIADRVNELSTEQLRAVLASMPKPPEPQAAPA